MGFADGLGVGERVTQTLRIWGLAKGRMELPLASVRTTAEGEGPGGRSGFGFDLWSLECLLDIPHPFPSLSPPVCIAEVILSV